MNMQARHSRKDSDDLSKLLVGHDDANLEFGGGQSQMDPSLTEPSLSYRQPKTSFTSFRAFLSRCNSKTYCIDNFLLRVTRVYVHPAVSSLVLLFAILIPVVLALVVVIPDCKNGDCLVIDKSIESFEIPGHISSERNDMVEVAGSHSHTQKELPNLRRKRFARALDEKPTEKTSYQTKPRWRLELVYLAIGDDDLNMFTKERLETVHAIDQSLMSQQGFNDYCWKWKEARADPFLDDHCVPPISLINFFYPSRSEFLKKEIFDGQGRNEDGTVIKNLTETSIQNTLKLLLTKTFTYWFVDDSFSKDNLKSRFLRAEMKFGSPLKPDGTNRKERDRYENFLKSYIEAMKKMSTDKVRLLYGGTDVFDYEVNKTLWADIKLAVFTIAFVGIFVLIFTRLSLFLTFFGIISIVTPLFVAYFFFRHVFQVPSLGILSGISAFIIIGIGVDDVFVFVNTFCQAQSARSLESRMLHTICTAGKATFFTSFTTAMAFFANCFSKMPAIRDFGLFMGLIVGSCWFTVFFTIPPALTLWHRYISKWEVLIYKMIFGKMNCALGSGRSDLPGDILQFLSGNERSYSQQASSSSSVSQVMELADRSLSQEDDTSLINLDSSSPNSQSPSPSSSDTDLTMFDDPNGTFDQQAPLVHRRSFQSRQGLPHQSHSSSCCRYRCGLQSFLYYWLAVPIQKCRYIVLVLFILILGVSIGFDSQIRPSTKPPAFFKESTNLQQLIELKYNMSSESLDTNDIAADQLVNEFQPSNDIDNPTPTTKKLMVTTQSNSPISESTPALKTPDTSGDKKKGDGIVKPPNSNTTPIPKGKTLKPTTASLQEKTSSSSPTKKPAVHSTKKPRTERKFTPTQKANKDKPLTKKTESNEGGSGNDIHPPTAIGTPITPPLCPGGCKPVPKPIVASSAVIFVILGLSKIDRSMIRREHVIEKKGEVIPDFSFTKLVSERSKFVSAACRLCKMISNNHELVREGGADCFPSWMWDFFLDDISINGHSSVFYKDCFNLTKPTFSSGSSQAKMYYMDIKNPYGNKTYWMKMAFESKIFKGKSSHEKVEDFEKWDSFLKDIISSPSFPEGFKSIFQTNQEWVNVFIEVVAVNSAIYGTVFSLMLCVFSVAVFTANACLTFIVMVTIVGVLTTVVGIFYLLSWHLGAVEAISLSILVGTSVDYCVHLVEGYIMAGNCIPQNLSSSKEIRGWRTRAAVSHIGTAILSSAITTVVASIPLCMTVIQLFAKFGQILAINTAVSIFFTLTICVALLCIMAPVKFRASLITSAKALVVVVVVCGLGTLVLYSVTLKVNIPGPSGEPIHF